MASSLLVIKVKFGETLRRLTASVDGNALSLNIDMLKEKIRSLFTFGSNVVFTMTYADEDGDMVILATEDDLRDIIRQSLNPLRITVNLSNGTPVIGSSLGTTSLAPIISTPFLFHLQQKQNQLEQKFHQVKLQQLQQLQQQNSRQNGQRFHYNQANDSQVSEKLNNESGSSDSE